ncbi:MAG: hypothetical protein PHV34_20280 [Verrucomicrobiae bacterium]|nr:hypothetical protein [Verrucomicrobiae bacterium]
MPPAKKSKEEQEQLLQTVQMFEVIVETSPNDVQSLEILKEAYLNLGQEASSIKTAKRIAKVYADMGQLSSAILEYEGILQRLPEDQECLAALTELENKMAGATGRGSSEEQEKAIQEAKADLEAAASFEDPNEAILKFFQEHAFIKEKDSSNLLSSIHSAAAQTPADQPAPAMLSIMTEHGIASTEKILSFLTEKTRLPYIPLNIYDVEPNRAMLLERDFCLKHMVLVFDQISKATLVATVNPFDARAKHEVESTIKGRIQWYLVQPLDLKKQLKDLYHIQ